MQTSRAFLALWAIGALLTFSACSCNGSVSGPPGNPADSGTALTCVQPGAACASGRPCCSGICDGTVCTDPTFCQANGESCSTDTDCCLNNCVNGTCSDKLCTDVGHSCTSGNDCCTGTCTGGTCASLPGGSCKVTGQSCATGPECCSTNCQSGFCAKAYYCQPVGDVCRSNDECCGHACTANNDGGVGRCASVSGGGGGGCDQAGEPCSSGGSTCCSRICIDPGSGVTVCQAAEGCRLTGTWCTDDQSCCGGGTNPNGSVHCGGDAGPGRCDNGQSCNPTGNICGARVLPDGGHINASENCCNDFSVGKDVCKLDSSGIPRCFGGASARCPTGYTGQPGCCIAAGQECQFKDQCCGGAPCVPGSNGKLVCTVASCTPVGATCSPSSSTCCSGTECRATESGAFACQNIPVQVGDAGTPDGGSPDAGSSDAGVCKANGTTCTRGNECCSQRCDGTCQAPLACQPQNGVCTSTADCCSGFACTIPPGASSGTCQTSSCTGGGQACTSNDQCCTGLSCLDNVTNYFCDGSGNCACKALLQ